jgi:hypothetical protein
MTLESQSTAGYVIFMIFVLGAQCIIASRRLSAQVDSAHARAFSTVSPQIIDTADLSSFRVYRCRLADSS